MRCLVLSRKLRRVTFAFATAAIGACASQPPMVVPAVKHGDVGKVAAVAMSDGEAVMLYTGSGPCIGSALYAEHLTPAGKKTPGCWVNFEGKVRVSYLDGERGNIPEDDFKHASEL